jgi:hypothetical protein
MLCSDACASAPAVADTISWLCCPIRLSHAHTNSHGCRYLRLDGSTPIAERRDLVDAWQVSVFGGVFAGVVFGGVSAGVAGFLCRHRHGGRVLSGYVSW